MKYERLTKKGGLDFSDKSLCLADEWGYSHIYNRLAELEDKIEKGTLIELPCPIRTMVYYIASFEKKNGFFGIKKYCTSIMEIPFELEMLESYGNNWFLTREEAEKRLRELQGDKE